MSDTTRRIVRQCQIESWCPGIPVACQKHVDQAAMEISDLREMAKQAIEAREEAQRMLAAANEREQRLIELCSKLKEIHGTAAGAAEEPPRPMCRPDPCEGIFEEPEEGSPT